MSKDDALAKIHASHLSKYFDNSHQSRYTLRLKALRFVGSSLDDLKNFPSEVRREAGFELDAVQRVIWPLTSNPCSMWVRAFMKFVYAFWESGA